jgi:hypothetical protein
MRSEYRIEAFKKASFCRHFENQVYKASQDKQIKFPFYLSAGQEYIPASIYTILEMNGIDANVFIQHRGHSHYLSKGADPIQLIDELWMPLALSKQRDDIVENLVTEINSANPTRIDCFIPDILAAGLRIVAVRYEWSYSGGNN